MNKHIKAYNMTAYIIIFYIAGDSSRHLTMADGMLTYLVHDPDYHDLNFAYAKWLVGVACVNPLQKTNFLHQGVTCQQLAAWQSCGDSELKKKVVFI